MLGGTGVRIPPSASLAISGHPRSPNDSTHINSVSEKKKEKNSHDENRSEIESSSPDPTRASIITHTLRVARD